MKKITLIFLTILFHLNSNFVWSADAEKALAAFESGDYVTALREPSKVVFYQPLGF